MISFWCAADSEPPGTHVSQNVRSAGEAFRDFPSSEAVYLDGLVMLFFVFGGGYALLCVVLVVS